MDNIQDRKRIIVSIFSDEFDKLDIADDMSLFEAQSKIREKLSLEPRQRGSSKGTIRKLLLDASDEKLKDVLEVLQEDDELPDSEDDKDKITTE